jgi:CheY-like chemotaxis protein
LVFGRPDSADCGEAALALAAQKPFDLIFLDVLMPGIDGYTTCQRIHETALNRHTQVVFVTSHSDIEARPQAEAVGGCGFIPKPVLASEIMLTALTFVLRARLNQSAPATAPEETACVEMA